MAYCTLADIKDQVEESRLIQLTDDEGAGTIGTARVDKAIADAGEEIDGYVGSRYTVPLNPAPAILRKLAVDIAVCNLFARRDKAPEGRVERYKTAIRFLEQVALGRISLGAADPDGTPPASDAPQMSADNPPRLFDRGGMRGF